MLRIHTEEIQESGIVTLRLEGKLIQPWGHELVRTWIGLLECTPPPRSVRIDLNAVSFVDEYGKWVLASLQHRGCQLCGSGLFITSILNSLQTNDLEPS
jgi:anti-anti-sigma regulatory factor